ncbi:MAG: hypothetical protein KDI13_10675 [Alphaproteobacteria bacterium]|nr:hypothetical protein [Alphaproteobacteria bacterium]
MVQGAFAKIDETFSLKVFTISAENPLAPEVAPNTENLDLQGNPYENPGILWDEIRRLETAQRNAHQGAEIPLDGRPVGFQILSGDNESMIYMFPPFDNSVPEVTDDNQMHVRTTSSEDGMTVLYIAMPEGSVALSRGARLFSESVESCSPAGSSA